MRCKPIQQRRVRGQFALDPEIFFGGNDPSSKVPTPHSVYHHTSGEGIAAIDHPLGQPESVPWQLFWERKNAIWRAWLDGFSWSIVRTSLQYKGRTPFLHLFHHHDLANIIY